MMSYSLQVAGRSRVVVGRTVEELSRLLRGYTPGCCRRGG